MDRSSIRHLLPLVAVMACSRPPALHPDPQAFAYRSRSKVADAAARQIAAAAAGDARRRPAWSEPHPLHAAGGASGDGWGKYLFGESRLYLGEYGPAPCEFGELVPADDGAQAYADGLLTVQQL